MARFDAPIWPTPQGMKASAEEAGSFHGEESQGGVIRIYSRGVRIRGGSDQWGDAQAGHSPPNGASGVGRCATAGSQASAGQRPVLNRRIPFIMGALEADRKAPCKHCHTQPPISTSRASSLADRQLSVTLGYQLFREPQLRRIVETSPFVLNFGDGSPLRLSYFHFATASASSLQATSTRYVKRSGSLSMGFAPF